MALEILIPPEGEPVSLSDVRAYLRIGTQGDEALLTLFITAARRLLKRGLGARSSHGGCARISLVPCLRGFDPGDRSCYRNPCGADDFAFRRSGACEWQHPQSD